MTIHLIKLAVGVDDAAHLRALQLNRLQSFGEIFHRTRMRPKRQDALLDGGSIYWVIHGSIAARQKLLAIREDEDEDGRACCRLVLDRQLVETCRQPRRAFQGWRYLETADAPADLSETAGTGDPLPPEMIEELKRLGLW
ncbi:DUF1489 family protein [Telmatospirillum siberiense]|uniref:DUF1489 domain-containing protein n=1 Tax=Telmatospirillum siberiense TaxID=382514 RepID=A0A2N3PWF7_9PROT|nr:DUF1489 domain-containing protein [Telmatospirillum siberiense]PKU24744.1 DUF1489 domain-containing protein [Telmatospirillum siberiense]